MSSNFSLTVLGSGGPFSNRRRASSGYLIEVNGLPRVLVDAGGGVFERLGAAGIVPSTIEMVLLTHTHIDHTGGLAPIVFDLYLRDRRRPLGIVGPAGRGRHPGCKRFTDLLFGAEGAWGYLHAFEGFGIDAVEVASDPEDPAISEVPLTNSPLERLGMRIHSVPVTHGPMPSVAFSVSFEGMSIVFSGDVDRASPPLVELAKGCELLVHDFALPERDVPNAELHAKPSEVGLVARDAGAKALLASHVMPLMEAELDRSLRLIRESFGGRVYVAADRVQYDIEPGSVWERVENV